MTEPVFCVLCGREGHRSSHCPMQLPPETADEKRERLIREAGESMQAAYRDWESTGCFDARGQADAERLRMEELIRGRSAAIVDRLESVRGLK